MVTTDIEYRGSKRLYRVGNDDLEVDASGMKSLFFKLTTIGVGFLRIVQSDNSSVYEDYRDYGDCQDCDEQVLEKIDADHAVFDDKIRVSVRVFADCEDSLRRARMTPTMDRNSFSLVIDMTDNQPTNMNNTFVISDHLHIEMVVTIPISLDHLEKLQLESNRQNIEINNLEGLFTESFSAKTNSGKISVNKHLRASAISLETVNSALGPMTLSATTSLSAKTVCGAIEIQQRPDWQHGSTTSSVRLETVSGSIQGRFVAGQHFTVKNVSGSVDVAVDAPESGSRPSVDLQTVSGIVNGRVSIGKQLKLSSVSGPVELQLDPGTEAPEVKGSTVSGDLTIYFLRPFAGDFTLTTLSGGVGIRASNERSVKYREKKKTKLSGRLSTKEVKVREGSIRLFTMYGNIRLNLRTAGDL
ncbi:hypothetical protein BC936DRAFT_137633 [Jimgerdemannia flammicorona]|uniref:DUF4097 domain-containing protein n=1 Tax=Jimgerdemannia flammicorona TaxID=994334 RepID=A0A433CWY4_9FUNG|nr:hypothetical protein BC936DRAFT_137633 [Jimgerdemannia flammicorona]